MNQPPAPDAASLQDAGHPLDHNYTRGSPHLQHRTLHEMIVREIRGVVADRLAAGGPVRILEIGAGHGAFSDHTLALGAQVTMTEMSRSSADVLAHRYAHNPLAAVSFDPTGEGRALENKRFDIVMCVSVLHHIPDYLAALASWTELLAPGGCFLTFQDPTWYPRRGRLALGVDRGAFYAWRLGQGDLLNGLRSFVRRLRGRYDETNARDMVEYHVLRQGCDENAIAAQLEPVFDQVSIIRYWSTPGALLQRLGERLGVTSTFGIVARGRTARPDPSS